MSKEALPIGKIIVGDCLEVMKDWPEGCVDLVLTDPPYGRRITRKDNQFGSASHKSYRATSEKWDDAPPSAETMDQIIIVSDHAIVFGGQYCTLPVGEKWLVWDKVGNISFDNPFSDCELAWTNFRGVIEKYTVIQQGFVRDTKDVRQHPTQKPTELMEQILTRHSNPDDLILDPFCGSGTTCVAAKKLGRRYIGIDISPEYCAIARSRLEAVDRSSGQRGPEGAGRIIPMISCPQYDPNDQEYLDRFTD